MIGLLYTWWQDRHIHAHGHAGSGESCFDIANGDFAPVEYASRQRGVGVRGTENIHKVLRRACAAGC